MTIDSKKQAKNVCVYSSLADAVARLLALLSQWKGQMEGKTSLSLSLSLAKPGTKMDKRV